MTASTPSTPQDQGRQKAGSQSTASAADAPALSAPNLRLIVTKAVLWFLVGVAAVVAVLRYIHGLGATTALSDRTPWGLWIGFDVLSGVALAAGGFVVAAAVYVFQREKYHVLARPAVLTAFLGYIAVILGLLVDLGKPWNIWRPIVSPNLHSPLFEVAMCVMTYTAVLALEFAPVPLERFGWARGIVRFLKKATLPLVVLGIALSTLHQSSLGTLFLLTEMRLHALWFSPILPLLFFLSAVGLGLGMVTLEGLISSWLYRREPEWPQLAGLTRAASVVLSLYVVIRLVDLAVRGHLALASQGGWFAALFWIELGMSAVIPALLFGLPRTRGTSWAIRWGAVLTVAGFILNRADVGGIAHTGLPRSGYVPALSELSISLGIVAGLGLIFLFCIERFRVWEVPPAATDPYALPAVDPMSAQYLGAPWFGGAQRAVVALLAGVVVGIGLMEAQLASRARTAAEPVVAPRQVQLLRVAREEGPFHELQLTAGPTADSLGQLAALPSRRVSGAAAETAAGVSSDETVRPGLLLAGSGAVPLVAFDHRAHQDRLGGDTSCASCHHRNVPLDRGTSCGRCHADVYRATDTFAHQQHVAAHGGAAGCAVCHADPAAPKTRAGSKACDVCHPPASLTAGVRVVAAAATPGMAPGYKVALHGLCIDCHAAEEKSRGVTEPYLSTCAACHRIDPQRVRDQARPGGSTRDLAAFTAGSTGGSAP